MNDALKKRMKELKFLSDCQAWDDFSQMADALRVAVECLESVADASHPKANTRKYWQGVMKETDVSATLATDTKICRETLAEVSKLLKVKT